MGMTKEEAKTFLTKISYDIGTVGMDYLTLKDGQKMRDAIAALDQECVINKIRAEIEQRPYGIANDSVIQGMKHERAAIIEFLDKYK